MNRIARYSLAAIGPFGTAGSQFLLSLQLLHVLPAEAFGAFSFLLVAFQFSTGLWSALFCAPLPVLISDGNDSDRAAILRCLYSANLAMALIAFLVFLAAGAEVGIPTLAAALFAAFAGMALLRWFARAQAYAIGAPLRTTASDIIYSSILLGSIICFWLVEVASLTWASGALFIGATLGLLPFGSRYLKAQFLAVSVASLPSYSDVWRRHAKWALVGVITTEATANAHAYLVTALAGPAAFAPVAASALVIRPIGVVMNALTDFERPLMARQIAEGRLEEARHAVRVFRTVMIFVWLVTTIVGGAVILIAPNLIFPPRYSMEVLFTGTVLWLLVSALRLLRNPESVLLQAAGWFRQLSYASIVSSGISIMAVILALTAASPVWSIGGVLIGEATFSLWLWQVVIRWRQLNHGPR